MSNTIKSGPRLVLNKKLSLEKSVFKTLAFEFASNAAYCYTFIKVIEKLEKEDLSWRAMRTYQPYYRSNAFEYKDLGNSK